MLAKLVNLFLIFSFAIHIENSNTVQSSMMSMSSLGFTSNLITSNRSAPNECTRFVCQRMHHRHHQFKRDIIAKGQGFGKTANENRDKYQDEILNQRSITLAATDILARLLHAEDDALEVATEYSDSLTEEFFHISGAYLSMAKKDGDENVQMRLERALKAAMEAKNATLRAEIQLLNKLLGAETDLERKQFLNTQQAGETLTMNNYYFFNLLDTMMKDVDRQPDGPQKVELQAKQQAVKSAAMGRLPPEERAKVPDPNAKK
jgi:hypothetical protein